MSSSSKPTRHGRDLSPDGHERDRSRDHYTRDHHERPRRDSRDRGSKRRDRNDEREKGKSSRNSDKSSKSERKTEKSTKENTSRARNSSSPENINVRSSRDAKPVVGSRFYDYASKDQTLPKQKKQEVIGSRYYHVKDIEKETEESEPIRRGKSPKDDAFVIGSRYYDAKAAEGDDAVPQVAKSETKKSLDPISSKTGGAYIPPHMLKIMQASIQDKSSADYQRISWEALKKSIHGLINKVNRTNIDKIIGQLLKENIVRGRGLLCRSIIQAQTASVTYTSVYAALVALINSRFPNIGELLLKRVVIQFRRGFKRNDKANCIAAGTFIAHLVNQRVAHEILALEILTLLVENPTDDSIEVAIAFLKEAGMKLTEVSSKGVDAIIQMLRNVLHERKSDARSMHMIEVIMQIRKDKFKDNPSIPEGLDLVEEEDQFTHLITLDDATDAQDVLNVFKVDPEYLEHEEKYKELSREIIGDDSDDDDEDGEEGDGDDEDDAGSEASDAQDDKEQTGPSQQAIIDNTETNLVALRRTIYLTIYSSLDFEECAHKLMKMNLKPGQEPELCAMILDCCCEMRTYERFFGLLAQRFCEVNRQYIPPFEDLFRDTYNTVHRLKTNQCRNVAKLFGHLLLTDAISWDILACIRLNEEDTTSSGRIFIKILFHELSEYMGLTKLNDRVKDATLQDAFAGLFPRDNPRNTRFSINFFTSIGLGGLTDDLREHLKTAIQVVPTQLPVMAAEPSSSSLSSSSSSEDLSDSSDGSLKHKKRKKKKSKHSSSKKSKQEKRKSSSSRKRRS